MPVNRLVFATGPVGRLEPREHSCRRFATELSEAIGIEVAVVVATTYGELANLVRRGDVQVAWLPPAVYVRCAEDSSASLMLSAQRSGRRVFRGVLFVPADAPQSVPEQLRGSTVAWVDCDSCAGYLFPRLALSERDLEPDAFFGKQLVLGSHHAVARAVEMGSADVGATFLNESGPGNALATAGWSLEMDRDAMRPILESGPIPADTICGTETLDSAVRGRVQEALAAMHESEDGARAIGELFDVERFVEVAPDHYDIVRRALWVSSDAA